MADTLTSLTSTDLLELPDRWRDAAQAEKLTEARAADARGEYWSWAADRLRWVRPWDTLTAGGFADLRYYSGGLLNVCDNCVDRHAESHSLAGRDAIVWEGEPGDVRRLTYAELRDQVSRFAGALRALGVRRGDVVAIHLPNLPEAFVAIHACNRIGAIYTVLFSGFSADAIRLRLLASRAAVVVTADASYRRGRRVSLLENLRQARQGSSFVSHTVVVSRTGEPIALQDGEAAWSDLLAEQSTFIPCEPLEANEPAFLIFTSGTESRPKGVVHSTAGFLVGAWANVQWQVGPQDGDVYWCAADVGWLTFPIQALVGGLAHGMTLVCYEGALDYPDRTRLLETAKRHGVTKISHCANRASHAESRRRRRRQPESSSFAKACDHPGRAARSGDGSLDNGSARRPGHQRLRADRNRLDLDLSSLWRRADQGRKLRNARSRALLRRRRRSRSSGSARRAGQPCRHQALSNTRANHLGRRRAIQDLLSGALSGPVCDL